MAAHPELIAAVPGPIETYVEALATAEEMPVVAIGACLIRQQEAAPLLRRILTHAAEGKIESNGQATQLFRTLHIQGGARDTLSFSPLLRLLRQPNDYLEWLLGDVDTETLPRIVVGVFDGNVDALFEGILNRELAGSIRGALLCAATFLTWEGRIDRTRMIALLERFEAEESIPGYEIARYDWTQAIALLGLRDLEPLVSNAERCDRLDDALFDRKHFDATLAKAEQAPDDKSRFEEANVGYIEDVVAALEKFPYSYHDDGAGLLDPYDIDSAHALQPITNPWRHVGRNDPCPCGSGKKAKRCCLST